MLIHCKTEDYYTNSKVYFNKYICYDWEWDDLTAYSIIDSIYLFIHFEPSENGIYGIFADSYCIK